MNCDQLTFTLADQSDFPFYYAIKAESSNIYWSGFHAVPDKTNLLVHFMAMLSNEYRFIYVLKESNVQVGFLSIDSNSLNSTFEISYAVSAQYA